MSASWHHDIHLFGRPYPTRHPVPERFRIGEVGASELVALPVLVQRRVMSGGQLAECTGLPLPLAFTGSPSGLTAMR